MGPPPKKILGAKNMQNLALFWTTLNFGDKYLWNRQRYSKSDKYMIYLIPSRIRKKVQ